MTSNKNLELFFNQYEDIISTGLEHNHSEKEIFNAIYSKEFNNYLRKGFEPRLNELNHVINFVKKFRSGELDYDVKSKSNSDQKIKVEIMRNNLHNLDLTKKDDYEVYKSARFEFVANEENDKLKKFIQNMKNDDNYFDKEIISNDDNKLVHNDGRVGNITIGYGFNTTRLEAEKEWNEAFLEYNKNNPDNRIEIPNMNDVINLKRGMTPRELEILTNGLLDTREKKLKILYGKVIDTNEKEVYLFDKLKPNERITIESLNFNSKQTNTTGSTIVGTNTRFYNNIKNYILSSDKKYLENAINEIKYSSNSENNKGIKGRRYRESILLDSTRSPLYSKPNEAPLPEHYKNKHFRWIWHSSGSKDPNKYHRDVLNGEIFKINSDPWKWMTSNRLKGCHCTYEIVD